MRENKLSEFKMKRATINTILRIVLQVIFFILAPGVFASALNGIKTIFASLGQGVFPEITSAVMILFATIIFTIIFGRFFCGWACSFGAVSDWIYMIGQRISPVKRLCKKIEPATLKYNRYLTKIKYIILIVIIILALLGISSILSGSSVWNAYALLIRGRFMISGNVVGWILLLIIAVSSLFIERFFCQYLCPMGAVYSMFGKFTVVGLRKERSQCGSCKLCTTACPAGLNLYDMDKIKAGECIKCLKCESVCFRSNVQSTILGKSFPTVIYILLAFFSLIAIYWLIGIISF